MDLYPVQGLKIGTINISQSNLILANHHISHLIYVINLTVNHIHIHIQYLLLYDEL